MLGGGRRGAPAVNEGDGAFSNNGFGNLLQGLLQVFVGSFLVHNHEQHIVSCLEELLQLLVVLGLLHRRGEGLSRLGGGRGGVNKRKRLAMTNTTPAPLITTTKRRGGGGGGGGGGRAGGAGKGGGRRGTGTGGKERKSGEGTRRRRKRRTATRTTTRTTITMSHRSHEERKHQPRCQIQCHGVLFCSLLLQTNNNGKEVCVQCQTFRLRKLPALHFMLFRALLVASWQCCRNVSLMASFPF